jgi:hypothetical protein
MNEFNQQNLSAKELQEMLDNGEKIAMFYHIPRHEVEDKDLRSLDKVMNTLHTVGKGAKKSLIITINGYDDTADELHEIKEVRDFMQAVLRKYPHILYYINTDFESEKWMMLCFADEVESIFHGERLSPVQYIEKFGFGYDASLLPQLQSKIKFYDNGMRMFKGILKHGKMKRDVRGARDVVMEYAFRLENAYEILQELKFTNDEVIKYIREQEEKDA